MNNCSNLEVNNFNIQGLTRLNEDVCYKNLRMKNSSKLGRYQTRNFKDCSCESINVKETSLQHPSIYFRDGYGWTSQNGCNIDIDSKLRNSRNLTNENCINQLNERPYLTTPYMGRGEGNVKIENKLLPSEDTFQSKSCNNLAGVYIDRFTPQLPCIRKQFNDSRYTIPEDNDSKWVRGGKPSRQMIRDKEYLKKCGYKYNGKYWIH